MKKRILGITAFLAVVVLGFVFFVSCGAAEDTEISITNLTSKEITIISDGSPKTCTVPAATGLLNAGTALLTKKGADIVITDFYSGSSYTLDQIDRYVRIDIHAQPAAEKKAKKGKRVVIGIRRYIFFRMGLGR